jgi:prophage regulatory protein
MPQRLKRYFFIDRPTDERECVIVRALDIVSTSQWLRRSSKRWFVTIAAAKRKEAEPEDTGLRRMLSEAELLAMIPISRTTLFRLERAGKFPKSTYISPNRRIWFLDEVRAWQNAVNELDASRGRGKGRLRRVSRGAT